MDEVKKVVKRTRRIDPMKKIAAIDKKIAALEAEKEELLKPIRTKQLIEEAAKTMTPEEIAEQLGVDLS